MFESYLSQTWRRGNVPDGLTIASLGDIICTEPVSGRVERDSPDLMRNLRAADLVVANFEGTALDLASFKGFPEAQSGGGWLLSSRGVPGDLCNFNIGLVGRANNHTTDWGVAGMRATNFLLDEAGISHAGSGETLSGARSAAIRMVRGARVGLVSFASRFEPNARAIDPLGAIPARPGISALRTTRRVVVNPEDFTILRRIRDAQPAGSVRSSVFAADERDGTVTLFGTKYMSGPQGADQVSFSFQMDERDREELLRAIRQAKQTTDLVIVSMHTHEPGNYSKAPPDFMESFARQAIDEGADMVIGHGPHQLRPIEIYRGRPIFYSLGNFFFMDNTWQPLTRDEYEHAHVLPGTMTDAELTEKLRIEGVFRDQVWFETVVAHTKFNSDGSIAEIVLRPVELYWQDGRDADRGIPRSAPSHIARRILQRLSEISGRYGTRIEMVGEVGVIKGYTTSK